MFYGLLAGYNVTFKERWHFLVFLFIFFVKHNNTFIYQLIHHIHRGPLQVSSYYSFRSIYVARDLHERCWVEIRTRVCHTAGWHTSAWATLHPINATFACLCRIRIILVYSHSLQKGEVCQAWKQVLTLFLLHPNYLLALRLCSHLKIFCPHHIIYNITRKR